MYTNAHCGTSIFSSWQRPQMDELRITRSGYSCQGENSHVCGGILPQNQRSSPPVVNINITIVTKSDTDDVKHNQNNTEQSEPKGMAKWRLTTLEMKTPRKKTPTTNGMYFMDSKVIEESNCPFDLSHTNGPRDSNLWLSVLHTYSRILMSHSVEWNAAFHMELQYKSLSSLLPHLRSLHW